MRRRPRRGGAAAAARRRDPARSQPARAGRAVAGRHSRRRRRSSRSPPAKAASANRPTAVNLALGLRDLGLKVGILDADIYGPSLPKLLAIREKPQTVGGTRLKPIERYGMPVMSIGFLIEEETPMIWRGPMVMSALTQMLREVEWGTLDVMVVDMPPGTGDAQLTMAQQVPLKGAVIVSTPQDLALIDARRGIAMFRRVNVPVLGIVENMIDLHLPALRHALGHFRPWRRAARSRAARRAVSRRSAAATSRSARNPMPALPVVATDAGRAARADLSRHRRAGARGAGGRRAAGAEDRHRGLSGRDFAPALPPAVTPSGSRAKESARCARRARSWTLRRAGSYRRASSGSPPMPGTDRTGCRGRPQLGQVGTTWLLCSLMASLIRAGAAGGVDLGQAPRLQASNRQPPQPRRGVVRVRLRVRPRGFWHEWRAATAGGFADALP